MNLNKNTLAYSEKCIHQLFEEQVEKTPKDIALLYDSQQLTYQQLNERSNRLAYYLRKKGVGPDTLVAIAIERSIEMIVGLLAILKAGGAYVPLDPSYPEDRLQFMLEDSGASVLLTQSFLKGISENFQGIIVTFDHEQNLIAKEESSNPNFSGYTILCHSWSIMLR